MTRLSLHVSNQHNYVHVNLTSSQAYEAVTLEHACSEYKDVFDGLGNLGTPLPLEVDEEVKTVQQPLRRVPEALEYH